LHSEKWGNFVNGVDQPSYFSLGNQHPEQKNSKLRGGLEPKSGGKLEPESGGGNLRPISTPEWGIEATVRGQC